MSALCIGEWSASNCVTTRERCPSTNRIGWEASRHQSLSERDGEGRNLAHAGGWIVAARLVVICRLGCFVKKECCSSFVWLVFLLKIGTSYMLVYWTGVESQPTDTVCLMICYRSGSWCTFESGPDTNMILFFQLGTHFFINFRS